MVHAGKGMVATLTKSACPSSIAPKILAPILVAPELNANQKRKECTTSAG